MDWYLDTCDERAVRALRAEFGGYLRRHAAPDGDVDAAELAFTEILSNAVEHAGGPIWVEVDWSSETPVVAVHDLGPGFELANPGLPEDLLSEGGRGVFLASAFSKELRVAAKWGGGTVVTIRLDLRRPAEQGFDPPRRLVSLPAPDEASADGTFAKEPFLRALVVQMAETLELQQGPVAAQRAVSQVGADVGGAMEEAYRRARGIAGRLAPEQIGELYVALKGAIDGGFRVVEATTERIVLLNTACPFGEAVRKAPSLCRMTSGVFGGIAARNAGRAAVHLEERIAIGDPQCRVVVWLGDAADEAAAFAHRYESASPADGPS